MRETKMRESPKFTKQEWTALVGHASKEPSRINLHQIAVCADGSAGSTDGHRCIMRGKLGEEPWLVPLDTAKNVSKLARAKSVIVVHNEYIEVDGVVIPYTPTSNTFPPLLQVCQPPTGEYEGYVGINAHLLSDSAKHLEAISRGAGSKRPTIQLRVSSALDPVHVQLDIPPETWLCVIMPIRV